MVYSKVKLLRRAFLIFSILLGILVPIYCWCQYPDFNPIHHPLSHFGVIEPTGHYGILL